MAEGPRVLELPGGGRRVRSGGTKVAFFSIFVFPFISQRLGNNCVKILVGLKVYYISNILGSELSYGRVSFVFVSLLLFVYGPCMIIHIISILEI